MSWVLALLAFAGVMAMLSTSVSVAVEAVHKLFGLRRSGLEEMLRALHSDVLTRLPGADLVDESASRKPAAVAFSRKMIESPAFGGQGRWWWARNIPGVNHVYSPKFEQLSTLQFIEQLAQTPIGQRLAQSDPDRVRQSVHTLAYQFERYGQAQRDYFGRRAKVISALVALAVVVGGNVNALAIYGHLANSPSSLSSTLGMLESRNTAVLEADVSAAREKLVRIEERARIASASVTSDPSVLASIASDVGAAQTELAALESQLDTSRASGGYSALDLPVGPGRFPFCAGSADAVDAQDPCNLTMTGLLGREVPAASLSDNDPLLMRAGAVGGRLATYEGLAWIFSILVTTGLVSLGAPFWFDLFRRLGSMVGKDKISSAIDRQRELEARSQRPGVRDAAASDVDMLTQALLTSAGKAGQRPAPIGMRYGRSSAEAIPSVYAEPAADEDLVRPVGMRQLRD